jgi:uncharacterized protein
MANDLATEFFDCVGRGDVDGALALTSQDFAWTVGGKPGGPFALAGKYDRAEYPALLGHVAASLPGGPQVEVVSHTANRDHIVIETHVTGTSADGVGYDNDVVYVFDIVNEKIVAVREYLDTVHAAEVFTR